MACAALQLIVNPDFRPVKGEKRRGYDNGFRRGCFDKRVGKEPRALDKIASSKYNRGYTSGYLDGYCSSDVEI